MTEPAVLPDVVHITLPDGGAATVPKADLDQAIAAGAHLQTDAEASPLGGIGGKALAAVTGAGRAATFGASDIIASEAMGLLGGESARKDVLRTFNEARTLNPGSAFVGELGGLAAGGVGALGTAAEAKAASMLGGGLLGKSLTMGVRMAAETGAMGAQQRITEEVLNDHELSGQAIFADTPKDLLLGFGGGALLGAGGHVLGGLLGKARGPMSTATADRLAGVEGAGREVAENAKTRESLIESLRKEGHTQEQAAKIADDIEALSQTKAAPRTGETYTDHEGVRRYTASDGVVLEEPAAAGAAESATTSGGAPKDAASKVTDWYADAVGGKGSAQASDLKQTFGEYSKRLAEQGERTNASAAEFTQRLTNTLRNVEDTANEAAFTQKPSMVRRLVDPAKLDAQADQVATLIQEAEETLNFWNETATKGGAPGPVKALRASLEDARRGLTRLSEGTADVSAELFLKTNGLKQSFDHYMKWGLESRYGLPPAIKGVLIDGEVKHSLEALTNRMRSGLEDTSVWGDVAEAQAKGNAAFSGVKARRDHLVEQLGVAIDQVGGIKIREGDFTKVKSFMGQMSGDDSDLMHQTVKSLDSFIDGMKVRAEVAKQFGELPAGEIAKLDRGLNDVAALRKSFDAARADAAAVNRIKKAQAEEIGHGVGGLLGLMTDTITRPYTTMRRLGDVAHKVEQVKAGIAKGFGKLTGGSGYAAAERAAPRAKDAAIGEMTHIRELAANPVALEARLEKMVGPLKDSAPKIAEEVKNTARRAVYFLAKESPTGTVQTGLLGVHNSKPRFSDQQVSEWESKRKAALGATNGTTAPEAILADMKTGRLNREAIKTIEYVSPQLFAHMQEMAQDELMRMESRGLLDKMPYAQKAAIATLLKVPADGTWRPDFVAMMQATKLPPPPPMAAPQGPAPAQNFGRKADKPTAHMWMTEAAAIEGAGGVM